MAKKQTKVTIYLEDDEVKKCTIDGKEVDPAASSTNGPQITININSNKNSDTQDSEEWDSDSRVSTWTSAIVLAGFVILVYWIWF